MWWERSPECDRLSKTLGTIRPSVGISDPSRSFKIATATSTSTSTAFLWLHPSIFHFIPIFILSLTAFLFCQHPRSPPPACCTLVSSSGLLFIWPLTLAHSPLRVSVMECTKQRVWGITWADLPSLTPFHSLYTSPFYSFIFLHLHHFFPLLSAFFTSSSSSPFHLLAVLSICE